MSIDYDNTVAAQTFPDLNMVFETWEKLQAGSANKIHEIT